MRRLVLARQKENASQREKIGYWPTAEGIDRVLLDKYIFSPSFFSMVRPRTDHLRIRKIGSCSALQVWPLTQFFMFPFGEKSLTHHRGNTTYSLPFLPATPSSPSWTLYELFELTRRPPRALDLSCASTEKQGNRGSGVLRQVQMMDTVKNS